jgi:hypothetical protein
MLVCAVAFAGAVTVLMPKKGHPGPLVPDAAPTAITSPSATASRSTAPLPPAKVVATGTYECPGYSGIQSKIPVPMLMADTFAWGNDPPAKVGNGSGDIDWRSNPYNNSSWYMWFHSLRWLGQGIIAGQNGDRTALTHSLAIIHDWVRDNPFPWSDVGASEATMHRANVMLCARQAVLTALHVRTPPAEYSWLDQSLLDHAQFMTDHWDGPWNHGTDQSIALFGVGCTLGRKDIKDRALERLTSAITTSIDAQGATNEQSVGYALFNYSLWGRASTALQRCGTDPGPVIEERRTALAEWLALATKSTGELQQLGDTIKQTPLIVKGTPLEYVGTLGKRGPTPPRRTAVFDAGYVFGRTGWGETRPFTQESTYSIRFGKPRQFHGHDDHMQITYTSHGSDVLIDAGNPGYDAGKWRDWSTSQAAHNVMTIPSAKTAPVETRLMRAAMAPTSEYYTLMDNPAPDVQRTRDVLVLKDPDLIVTLDRGQSTSSQRWETLWHLNPSAKVSVQSPSTAIATKPGDPNKTYLLQIPYQQDLPADSVSVVAGRQDPVQGWYFPDIFHKEPAPVVTFGRNGTSATILSAIVPAGKDEAVAFSTHMIGSLFFVDLTIGKRKVTIRVQPDGRLTRLG